MLGVLGGCGEPERKGYDFENHSEITEHNHSENIDIIFYVSYNDSTLHVMDSVCAGKELMKMQQRYFDAILKIDSIERRMAEMFNQANTMNINSNKAIFQ